MRIITAALLLLALACQADQKPQAIEAHDACASCKMAISQPQYAAQVVDKEGNAYKFDDIGCMLRYLRDHTLSQRRLYVMDYVNRQWLEAERAVFVRSDAIKSPMAGGVAAFREQSAAQQFLKNSSGQMASFAELIGGEPPAMHRAD
jgi:copper chaperone NosL